MATAFVALSVAGPPAIAKSPDRPLLPGEATELVRALGDAAVEMLSNDQLTQREKVRRFRHLLNQSFALKGIARFALGRYWRQASLTQRRRYLKLFEDYTVNAQYTKTDYRYTAPHSLAPFVLSGLGFAFARDDDVAAFKLQVSRPITDRVSGFAKFDFTDTTSNIPLFTYSQTVFGAGVLARF